MVVELLWDTLGCIKCQKYGLYDTRTQKGDYNFDSLPGNPIKGWGQELGTVHLTTRVQRPG